MVSRSMLSGGGIIEVRRAPLADDIPPELSGEVVFPVFDSTILLSRTALGITESIPPGLPATEHSITLDKQGEQ